jgi:hypothetical protein
MFAIGSSELEVSELNVILMEKIRTEALAFLADPPGDVYRI